MIAWEYRGLLIHPNTNDDYTQLFRVEGTEASVHEGGVWRETIAQWGLAGWEMVGAAGLPDGSMQLFFKRPVR